MPALREELLSCQAWILRGLRLRQDEEAPQIRLAKQEDK
jgi:hypothetical protein